MSRTVLVTGATSGFGESIARKFNKEGYSVILTGRRAERLESICSELSVNGPVLPLCFDIQDKSAVDKALESFPHEFSQISILVNNAGLALGLEGAHQANLSDWETMIDTNIKGLLYCTRKILPRMIESGQGHVINIGSIAGNWPYPGANVYGATKAFVRQFSLNLRCDVIGTGVRVTNIEPGLAETEFSVVRFKGNEAAAKSVYSGTIALCADDIAESVYWASTQPAHVNVNSIEIMATSQAWAPFAIARDE